MSERSNAPAEMIKGNIASGQAKGDLHISKMILLGIMAGMFIAFSGVISNTAVHNIAEVGHAKLIAGVIFPVGLMMIVFCGGELFTGNCTIIMALLDKKTTLFKMVRNLVIVYFSNLVGALIIDVLVYFSGNLNLTDGALGAYTIKVAMDKVALEPVNALCSGILCNILVCVAVLMAGTEKDVAGKVMSIFFPIFAFVVGGFEHCVANMYYIPTGIMAAQNPEYVAKAQELYGYTAEQIANLTPMTSLHNFIPVTVGNMIGGILFVGVSYYLIHIKDWEESLKPMFRWR